MTYKISFSKSAVKDLEFLPAHVTRRIFPKIELLAYNPRPQGCKKMQGSANAWRIRIGDYRVVYLIFDSQILVNVIGIKHRRDIYR